MTTRLITRYGSRKLYDTAARRYVSLDELAAHVRDGAQLRVVDKRSAQDVTAQTLALVVYERLRQGEQLVTSELLHDVIRSGVGQLQEKVDQLVSAGVERVRPLLRAREEMDRLRQGIAEIERSLQAFLEEGKHIARRSAGAAKPRRKRKRN